MKAKRGEMMEQRSRSYCAILTGVLLISGVVFTVEAFAADQNPCSEDLAKFCSDLQPGRRAMMECLEQHEAQLSDACKAYEAKMEKPRMESREVVNQQMRVRTVCREDTIKFCSAEASGGGGIGTCLSEHTSELSAPCKDAIEAARGGGEERTAK
jgi:hypothetical protein